MTNYLLLLFLISVSATALASDIIDDRRLPELYKDETIYPDIFQESVKPARPLRSLDLEISAGTKVYTLYEQNVKATEVRFDFKKEVFFPWLKIGSKIFYQQFTDINKTYNFYPFGNVSGRIEKLMGGGVVPELTIAPVFWGISPFASAGYRFNYMTGKVRLNDAVAVAIPDVYKSVNDKTLAMASHGMDVNFGVGYYFTDNFSLFFNQELSQQVMKYPDFLVNGQNQVAVVESEWTPMTFTTLYLGLGFKLWF